MAAGAAAAAAGACVAALAWSMCAATAPSTSLLFTPLPQVVSISPSERRMVVSYPHLPEGEQEKTYQVGAWQ